MKILWTGDTRWVGPVRVLARRRQFRVLFLGVSISRIGDTLFGVALAWLVLRIGTPADLGLLILIGGIPRAASAPIAGYLLDRYGPWRTLCLDNGLRSLLLLVIPLLSAMGALRVEYLYPLVIATGLLSSATEVGQEVLVPALVDDNELEMANAVLSATFDLAEWIGPALAGLTVALAGIDPAIFIDAGSFLVMAVAATALPSATTGPVRRADHGTLSRFVQGFPALWAHRGVFALTLATVAVLGTDGALQVFWPTYSRGTLHSGAATYGLLISAAGIGSLAGTLLLTRPISRLPPSRALPLTIGGSGVCVLLFAIIHTVLPALLLAVLVGLLAAPFYPVSRAMLQRLVPERDRGRVFGARIAITTGGFPAGAAIGGLLLASTSLPATALIIAAAHIPIALRLLALPDPERGTG
jgi:MFS family permease